MLRPPSVPSSKELGKLCAGALILLVPGSFFVLPAVWLVHRWRKAGRLGEQH